MHTSVYQFFGEYARAEEFRDKLVLEVGSFDVNGGLRREIVQHEPTRFIGTDMRAGPGVDLMVPAAKLVETFVAASFDAVISTEMLEHCEDWRAAIRNMKDVLRPYGLIYLTTRSVGFPPHDFPADYWRFSIDQMRAIFADFDIQVLINDPDPGSPGVFVKARKGDAAFSVLDLGAIEVSPVEETVGHQKAW